jgi:hypothetical protein
MVPLMLSITPLLVNVPEVVITPPLAMLIVPSFTITPLLVTVPMSKLTFDAITSVSVGPITRVVTTHVEVTEFHVPPTAGDSQDILSLTVEVSAAAFGAERAKTEINATNTGSIRIFFMFVIISILADIVLSRADMNVYLMNKSNNITDKYVNVVNWSIR